MKMSNDLDKVYEINAEIVGETYQITVKEFELISFKDTGNIKHIRYKSKDGIEHGISGPKLNLDTPLTGRFDAPNKPGIAILTCRGDLIEDYKKLIKNVFIEKLTDKIQNLNNLLKIIESSEG